MGRLAIATLAVIAIGSQAEAATFNFSFDITGADYAGGGTFTGDLLGDGDTIVNMADMMLSYVTGGTPYSNTGNLLIPGGTWSLLATTGFWTTSLQTPAGMFVETSFSVVGFEETSAVFTYNPSDFSVAQVPLPASALLLIGGLGGLVALRRRRTA